MKDAHPFKHILQAVSKVIMDNEDCLLLDVRELDEYKEGHIKGAKLLALSRLNEEMAKEVIPIKDTKLIVYCRSDKRSRLASSMLHKFGYTDINEFDSIGT